ncbi:MAG: hypothetical protein AAAB35_14255 [Phyllobacterium sp.]|uniref:hypothetical protein n=1 Tax=Phyllobacterium sp. TaxID=1871046 RepID=UPI0030EFC2AD
MQAPDPSTGQTLGHDFKMYRFTTIELPKDRREIGKARIAAWPEHPHQVLRIHRHSFAELIKADGRVDVVSYQRLAGIRITRRECLNSLAKKCCSKPLDRAQLAPSRCP